MMQTDRKTEGSSGRRPEVDQRYLRPARANAVMKKAKGIRQTVYLYGAAGFGKSSFVADFLSRRKYLYYSIERDPLEEILLLGDKLGQRGENGAGEKERIVVIDDLHSLVAAEERERCCGLLRRLAEDRETWLILLSRAPLPAWLKPLYIEQIFVNIGEEQLRFTPEETEDYLDRWELKLLPGTRHRLKTLAKGYPLFLRIAMLRQSELAGEPASSGAAGQERALLEERALEQAKTDLYDYLETHVYDNWDVELQEFLLDMAVVERFDLQMARIISRKSHAGRLILAAQETGNFLKAYADGEDTVYEMREPMRDSMRRRMQERCSAQHIEELYMSAGSSYEIQERYSEALGMYAQCRNEEGISRLLISNARRYVGNGHYWEMRRYYMALSEETIRQSPELMAGMSMLQSILMNDDESERWYRELEAYVETQSGSARKAAKARLLYLDIALPQRGTGNMTETLKKSWTFVTQRKAILPEISLTNNQPSIMHGGKDFCEWSRRDRELAASIGKPVETLLGGFGKGLVHLALAESFFEKGCDSYEVSTLAQKGRLQAQAGGKPEQVFVGTALLAWLSLFNNHPEDALESLEGFKKAGVEERSQLAGGVDALKAWLCLYLGRNREVSDWMQQAPDETEEFCTLERFRYTVKARAYIATGRRERAESLLMQLLMYAEKRQRTYLGIEARLLLALVQFRQGAGDAWIGTLQEAVSAAEDYHFVRVLTREGAALRQLFKREKIVWKDDSFKRQVLRECESMANSYPAYLNEKQEGVVFLNDKAIRILRLQSEGMTTREIADKMGLSAAGVKYYNRETYQKLGVTNRAAAIAAARDKRLI